MYCLRNTSMQFRDGFIACWQQLCLGSGLHDILHAIVMHISSVKPVLWLLIHLHHLFSNGAAFNTQSRSSPTSYAIRTQSRRCDIERNIV